jgi:thymidylate synthase (FAD)
MPRFDHQHVIDVIGLGDEGDIMRKIEHCGRVAYATWAREAPGSAEKFVDMIVRLGHESVLEHHSVTFIVQCDRATAQQLTRHRIASFTMQSQRYCNYSAARFDGEITFIDPEFAIPDPGRLAEAHAAWELHMAASERAYLELITAGCPPEDARSVLPNSTSCVLAMTANLREWRHVFALRTEAHAQHNVRRLTGEMLARAAAALPHVFADLVAQEEGEASQ